MLAGCNRYGCSDEERIRMEIGGIYPMLYAFFDAAGRLRREAVSRQIEEDNPIAVSDGAHAPWKAHLKCGRRVRAQSARRRVTINHDSPSRQWIPRASRPECPALSR